jgi:hypothetical protein
MQRVKNTAPFGFGLATAVVVLTCGMLSLAENVAELANPAIDRAIEKAVTRSFAIQ